MPFFRETPSSVLYEDLRAYAGLSNIEAARILLSARIIAGGKSPRDKAESRTFLSRSVVHANPSDIDPSLFADFGDSVPVLCSIILQQRRHTREELANHYAGNAADNMARALKANGLDSTTYLNEVQRLSRARFSLERERLLLLLMLFCATGCLADAPAAASIVEDYARHSLREDVSTATAQFSTPAHQSTVATDPNASIGLVRIIDGAMRPPIYPVDPDGTLVGSLASGPGNISDVEADVSRQHLRIWREGGAWYCQGLHSTNGTILRSTGTEETVCVEPPKTKQTERIDYPPQRIHESDRLVLGESTEFLVVRVHRNA